MAEATDQVEYLEREGGRIAYEVAGSGPLIVLAPGLADLRSTYRFLAPLLVDAGFRVARCDLRGLGLSSVGWPTYTHADVAGDLLALVDHLGAPAILVGQSFSGGAVTIAASREPEKVRAAVEIAPFTRPPKYSLGAFLTNAHQYRRGALLLARYSASGGVPLWLKYLDVAYPGRKPADWTDYLTGVESNLKEPGRADAAQKMVASKEAHATLKTAAAALPDLRVPLQVIVGELDSDFPDPRAEAMGIASTVTSGLAEVAVIAGAGHYPHAQYPQQTAEVMLAFVRRREHG